MPRSRYIKIILGSLCWLATPSVGNAQIDTAYIRPLEYKTGIRLYTGQKLLHLDYDDDKGTERFFSPNSPVHFGIGLAIYNTVIGFDIGYGFRLQDKEKYGKTKAFDFQLHHYNRRFVVDVCIQRYKGFYEDSDEKISLHPEMQVNRYSIHGHYVLNHKRFSYKAAFAQTERQVRSAGSWLLGAEYYWTKIRSDEPLTNEGYSRSKNYQIGINGGYAYIWALGRYWNIGIATTAGIGFGNEAFEGDNSKSVSVYPILCPRFSTVYDRDSWALALTYAGNILFLPSGKEGNLNIHSGQVKFAFIKRFGKPRTSP
jgi:hypothetical protein